MLTLLYDIWKEICYKGDLITRKIIAVSHLDVTFNNIIYHT